MFAIIAEEVYERWDLMSAKDGTYDFQRDNGDWYKIEIMDNSVVDLEKIYDEIAV